MVSRKRAAIVAVMLIVTVGAGFAGGDAEEGDGFIIGISNPWVGSEWRTQMVDNVLAAAQPYIDSGLIQEVIVQSFDTTLEGQIDQVRNLMGAGADLILINPADARVFNPVIREAAQRGVIVIGTDTELASPDAINVAIDQSEWARISARWLAEKLDYEGNIVTINGIAGHPANTARVAGYRDVFAQHDRITILNETNADWDNARSQSTMQSLLATYPDIDGVWVQDGMAEGALRALLAADRRDIPITGEARVGYLRLWDQERIDGIGVANPPGAMTSAFYVGLNLLRGRELRDDVFEGPYDNTIYVPIPVVVTNVNFDTIYRSTEAFPDYYSVDGSLTDAQAEQYFTAVSR